jgi:aryl-alcohol dehydrogenase-like predicted oxidoreductase
MSFTHTTLRAVGKPVHRLGLALNYGIAPGDLQAAVDLGPNYLFWTQTMRNMAEPVKQLLAADRDRYVFATGPTLAAFPGQVTRSAERLLRQFNVETIDVLHLFWVGKSSAWTDGTRRAMEDLRTSGKVKAIAMSIHDRPRAGKIAAEGAVDQLMVRYNAAHPGAEVDIFPHLTPKTQVVSYTATAWKRLLKGPEEWEGRRPTAADCYRFALSNPHVDVTLCGPGSLAELKENLDALESGPMDAQDLDWMRRFGKTVHSAAMSDRL